MSCSASCTVCGFSPWARSKGPTSSAAMRSTSAASTRGSAPRGDVEEGATVGTPAALADLPRDGAGDDVAREELRRAPGLGLAPGHDLGHPAVCLRLVLGDVLAEHLRDVAEHEALAL